MHAKQVFRFLIYALVFAQQAFKTMKTRAAELMILVTVKLYTNVLCDYMSVFHNKQVCGLRCVKRY